MHGLESALGIHYDQAGRNLSDRGLVRYADDLVIFAKTKEDAVLAMNTLSEWLLVRGLTLSGSKTHITAIHQGFNFLGFQVRQYPDSTSQTGWKLLIKPSKESLRHFRVKVRQIWLDYQSSRLDLLMQKLNPIIRGFANFYRTVVASHSFRALDNWLFVRQKRYAKRRHPKHSQAWRYRRYWGRFNLDRNDHWVFGDRHSGQHLLKFSWFKIRRHPLVKGTASPDDPQLQAYWQSRQQLKVAQLIPSYQKLAYRQGKALSGLWRIFT